MNTHFGLTEHGFQLISKTVINKKDALGVFF